MCLQTAHASGSAGPGPIAPERVAVSGGSFTCFHGQLGLSQQPGGLPSLSIKSFSRQHE